MRARSITGSLASLLILSLATPALADVTLTYTRDGADSLTVSVGGGKVRMDEIDGDSSVIIDPAAGTMIAINHRQRAYIVMDAEFAERVNATINDAQSQIEAALANVPEAQREMVRRMMEAQQGAGGMMGGGAPAVPNEITNVDTGRTASYGGYSCRINETRVDGTPKSTACTAEPGAVGVSSGDFRAIVRAFEWALEYSEGMTEGVDFVPSVSMPPIDGVMVQQRDLPSGRDRILTGVDGGAVPASRFQPPAGYSEEDPLAGR